MQLLAGQEVPWAGQIWGLPFLTVLAPVGAVETWSEVVGIRPSA